MTSIRPLLCALSVLVLFTCSAESTEKPNLVSSREVLNQTSQALNWIARKAAPAVVSITSIKVADVHSGPLNFHGESEADQTTLGIGSGVILREDGLILTNYHVIENSEKVSVTLDDKHKAVAHVIGGDPKTDLAVIKIEGSLANQLPTLAFADSEQIQVGDSAIAIGSPFGLSRTVTSGIISAVGRAQLGMLDIEDFIQTDAAINPGNSGGPLLNTKGEIIGINTAIFSQNGGFIGIGFAVPSKIANEVYKEIVSQGRVIRGWAGMSAQDLSPELAKYFKAPQSEGAVISQIAPKGPASTATLKTGDIILKYGENKIFSADHLKSLISNTKPKQVIDVEVLRNGKKINARLLIQEQPLSGKQLSHQLAGQVSQTQKKGPPRNFGILVEDIPPELTALFNIPVGAGAFVSEVKSGSPAFMAGISVGDIILSANRIEIHRAQEFNDTMKALENHDLTVLYVQRGPEEKLFVPLNP